ncbi:MAG: hypothetical protein R3C12_12655 [Planctomycetaceae bacterium]
MISSMISRKLTIRLCTLLSLGMFGGAPAWGQPGGPKPVVVTAVVEQEIAAGQTFVGTITPVRTRGSGVGGRRSKSPSFQNEGDFVRAGQPLAQLLTATINLEIEAAESELELRQYEHAELKNGSLKEEIDQARAAMLSAQAVQEYQLERRLGVPRNCSSGMRSIRRNCN